MSAKVVFNEDFSAVLRGINSEFFDFEKVKRLAENNGLLKKSSLHVTIIGRETGKKIHDIVSEMSNEKKEKVVKKIDELLNSFEWNFSVRPEIYFLSKAYPENLDDNGNSERRWSIIQLVDFPDIEPFYEKLNSLLETGFEVPLPSHVTLFSYSTIKDNEKKGIGVYSKEQFWGLDPVRID